MTATPTDILQLFQSKKPTTNKNIVLSGGITQPSEHVKIRHQIRIYGSKQAVIDNKDHKHVRTRGSLPQEP